MLYPFEPRGHPSVLSGIQAKRATRNCVAAFAGLGCGTYHGGNSRSYAGLAYCADATPLTANPR